MAASASSYSSSRRTRITVEVAAADRKIVYTREEEQTDSTTEVTQHIGSLSLEPSPDSCTYQSTKTGNRKRQPFYKCFDCFTEDNLGCCKSCMKRCHAGHRVQYDGDQVSYCDCGLKSCATSCKLGSKCTFDQCGEDFMKQGWYQCVTCWGEESSFGCCLFCSEECHSGHNLVYHEPSNFYCDCGKYEHKLALCTYVTTGPKFNFKQKFYRCYTCFSAPNEGCCYQCMKNCHKGHDTEFVGTIGCFCDCGLDGCAISCKLKD